MGKRDPEREQRWRRTLELWRESGQPARQFCQERGLSVSALYSWRRELRRRDTETKSSGAKKRARGRFVQLRVEPASACIEITLTEALAIRVPVSLDEETMTRVISAARKAAAC
jgi:transposase-like protein